MRDPAVGRGRLWQSESRSCPRRAGRRCAGVRGGASGWGEAADLRAAVDEACCGVEGGDSSGKIGATGNISVFDAGEAEARLSRSARGGMALTTRCCGRDEDGTERTGKPACA